MMISFWISLGSSLAAIVTAFEPEFHLWPLPQEVNCAGDVMYLMDETSFRFYGMGPGGQLTPLTTAFERYRKIIFPPSLSTGKSINGVKDFQLNSLIVEVASADASITLQTDESYKLLVTERNGAHLEANTVYGALRGIETFSQLIERDVTGIYRIASCIISDKPRYKYRSIMIDTARHFVPLEVLLQNLDVMSYNKFNVLHWHIVDDQSFPYESYLFPELSAQGAYDQNHIYSQSDVARLIEYAKNVGIRVIPEFDTPGHTLSWKAQRDLLTPCYNNSKPTGEYGPINPTLESTYTFLQSFFKEISDVFPDQYVYLGGDEIDLSCWMSNPDIKKWMKEHKIRTGPNLLQYYESRLVEMLGALDKDYIVWQDVFDNGVKLDPDTVIGVWRSWTDYFSELFNITAAGYKAVLQACWYMDLISYGDTWHKYYACDPQDFNGTAEQKELVMGGGATLWAEYVDSTNLISRLWPRASVVGERLWSELSSTTNLTYAEIRLHYHRCRMLSRGIPAEPIEGPSYCPQVYIPPL